MTEPQHPAEDIPNTKYAFQIAFLTMRERCQQLQSRLTDVEEENIRLKLESERNLKESTAIAQNSGSNEAAVINALQQRIEELQKQKTQLTHHIFMVASENRQLWNRLTRLMRTNKTLGNHLTKINDTLKQHPANMTTTETVASTTLGFPDTLGSADYDITADGVREQSFEEISLKLINSIMMEKSDLEQQYAEMVEIQNSTDVNLQNIGFTYPEDTDTDSLEQLKQHDSRLTQTKDALMSQQNLLKRAVQTLRRLKKGGGCKNCRKNASKKMCQIGTQFDSDSDSIRENGATQTSLPLSTTPIAVTENGDVQNETSDDKESIKMCPLCGVVYGETTTFEAFHEHVLGHFNEKVCNEGFELVH